MMLNPGLWSVTVSWCEQVHWQLSVTKTNELVMDLRRVGTPVTPVSVYQVTVDNVEDFK